MLVTARKNDITVSKTISMPLSMMEAVNSEAGIMGCNFSLATTRLLAIAINLRVSARRDGP